MIDLKFKLLQNVYIIEKSVLQKGKIVGVEAFFAHGDESKLREVYRVDTGEDRSASRNSDSIFSTKEEAVSFFLGSVV